MEPDCTQLSDSSNIKAAMACCHSLNYIEGEISGDPLDVKMYEATGWELEEVGEETNRYDIIMPTVVKPKVCLQIYMQENLLSQAPCFVQYLVFEAMDFLTLLEWFHPTDVLSVFADHGRIVGG